MTALVRYTLGMLGRGQAYLPPVLLWASAVVVLTTNDLVQGDNAFFAVTGITDGEVLKGVHYDAKGVTTQSLVMRSKSGTVRLVNGRHQLQKLRDFSDIDFG